MKRISRTKGGHVGLLRLINVSNRTKLSEMQLSWNCHLRIVTSIGRFRLVFLLLLLFGVNALIPSCDRGVYSKHFRTEATETQCATLAREISRYDVDISNFVVELLEKGVNKQFFVPMTKEFDEVRNAPNNLTDDQVAKICPYQAQEVTKRIYVVYDAETWQDRAFYAIAVKDYAVVERGQCSRDELQDKLDRVEPEKILSKIEISAPNP